MLANDSCQMRRWFHPMIPYIIKLLNNLMVNNRLSDGVFAKKRQQHSYSSNQSRRREGKGLATRKGQGRKAWQPSGKRMRSSWLFKRPSLAGWSIQSKKLRSRNYQDTSPAACSRASGVQHAESRTGSCFAQLRLPCAKSTRNCPTASEGSWALRPWHFKQGDREMLHSVCLGAGN